MAYRYNNVNFKIFQLLSRILHDYNLQWLSLHNTSGWTTDNLCSHDSHRFTLHAFIARLQILLCRVIMFLHGFEKKCMLGTGGFERCERYVCNLAWLWPPLFNMHCIFTWDWMRWTEVRTLIRGEKSEHIIIYVPFPSNLVTMEIENQSNIFCLFNNMCINVMGKLYEMLQNFVIKSREIFPPLTTGIASFYDVNATSGWSRGRRSRLRRQ